MAEFDIYHRGGTERIAVPAGQPLPASEQNRWIGVVAQKTLGDDLAQEIAEKGFAKFNMEPKVGLKKEG